MSVRRFQNQILSLRITPPANSDADFDLTVTATAAEAENGDTTTTVDTIHVTVDPVADAPTLTVAAASGDEDTAIVLSIDSALTDTDGSETLSITIGGVPTGAVLSAGTDNGDGSWTLTAAQLAGLMITPPANSDADFDLTVTATAAEAENGDTTTTVDTIHVTVDAINDVPAVDLNGPDFGIEFTATFMEDGGAVSIVDGDAMVSDMDSVSLASLTATITNLSDVGDEILTVDTTGTLVVAAYDSGTGVLMLTGGASLAEYEAVLRTLTYENTSQDPTGGDRTIEVVADDGTDVSAVATSIQDAVSAQGHDVPRSHTDTAARGGGDNSQFW
jgi:hypothetical protein